MHGKYHMTALNANNKLQTAIFDCVTRKSRKEILNLVFNLNEFFFQRFDSFIQ